MATTSLPMFRSRPRQAVCRKGHPRVGNERQCLTCQRIWHRAHPRRKRTAHTPGGNIPFRPSRPGVVLARGPLDYDVPVTVRCQQCGGIFERPLSDIGTPCPHCARYPEAAA